MMRTLCLLVCCTFFAGCSQVGIANMPFAAGSTGSASPQDVIRVAKKLTFLYDFKGSPDGSIPSSALLDVNGTLYGTTQGGGATKEGTAFAITPGTERLIHSFAGPPDGKQPWADLIELDGTFYGTAYQGGATNNQCTFIGCGTVFKLTPAGTETVLHRFMRGTDGGGPVAGLIDVGGTLYGTTYYGGTNDRGTVFEIALSGKESVIHTFGTGGDGASPEAGLVLSRGMLYGTTLGGGTNGFGTVFRVGPSGTERVVHSFTSGSDGAQPVGSLIDVGGTLYGTTTDGGSGANCNGFGCGTVFAISPSGVERIVYNFKGGSDGAGPNGSLIHIGGRLYGTTFTGGTGDGCGSYGCGTIFAVTASGAEEVLYSFTGGSNGENPLGALIVVKGTLYGTTSGVFNGGNETVFGLPL